MGWKLFNGQQGLILVQSMNREGGEGEKYC